MKRKLFVILTLAAVIMALYCSAALADAPAFTSQPVGGTIVPDGGRIIRWKTNFTPQKVVLGYSYYHDDGFPGGSGWTFIPQKTIESSLQSDMQTTLTYSLAVTSEKWTVRAYYSDTQFAESSFFPIDVVSRQFTVSPAGGTISPGIGQAYGFRKGTSAGFPPVPGHDAPGTGLPADYDRVDQLYRRDRI